MVQMSDVMCSIPSCGNTTSRDDGLCNDCVRKALPLECANVLCDNNAEANGLCTEHMPKRPKVSLFLQCSANPDDHLTAYVTESKQDFAIVLTNNDGQKISVLLSLDASLKLQDELNNFIINN